MVVEALVARPDDLTWPETLPEILHGALQGESDWLEEWDC